jgi:hypothetical protein
VTALTKKSRPWWRNFSDEPSVQLRLAGKKLPGPRRGDRRRSGHLADAGRVRRRPGGWNDAG